MYDNEKGDANWCKSKFKILILVYTDVREIITL